MTARSRASSVWCGFFGLHIPQARVVAYLDAENPADEIDLRYQSMLLHFTP
jgi:hypothetical protein